MIPNRVPECRNHKYHIHLCTQHQHRKNQIDSVKFSQARIFQYEHAYADNIIALITSITLI
jgi:hypothetical protein